MASFGKNGEARSVLGRGSSIVPLLGTVPLIQSVFDGFSDDSEMSSAIGGALGDDTARVTRNQKRNEQKMKNVASAWIETAIQMMMLAL